jgi:hypothetical protein
MLSGIARGVGVAAARETKTQCRSAKKLAGSRYKTLSGRLSHRLVRGRSIGAGRLPENEVKPVTTDRHDPARAERLQRPRLQRARVSQFHRNARVRDELRGADIAAAVQRAALRLQLREGIATAGAAGAAGATGSGALRELANTASGTSSSAVASQCWALRLGAILPNAIACGSASMRSRL